MAAVTVPTLSRSFFLQPRRGEKALPIGGQQGVAEGIAQKEIDMKLGKDGRASPEAQKVAEGISQKEIDMSLRKAGPKSSTEEQGLAEGIAKKEIAIDTGDAAPTQSWFGRKKAKPSPKPEPAKVIPNFQIFGTTLSFQRPDNVCLPYLETI